MLPKVLFYFTLYIDDHFKVSQYRFSARHVVDLPTSFDTLSLFMHFQEELQQ